MESEDPDNAMPLTFLDPPRRPPLPIRFAWGVIGILLCAALAFPYRFGTLRLAMVVGGVLFWMGAVYLFRRQPILRLLCLIPALLMAVALLLPDRPVNPDHLRSAYLASLTSFEGTPYAWGGETHIGIDCSGLVRGGLIDACLKEGITTGNRALLREAISMWWYDCSARALGEEYQGRTRFLMEARSLNELDYTKIEPGDVAVTSGGIHTMAYLGNQTWIQADPAAYRVVRTHVPSSEGWFIQSVRLMRWSTLATPAAPTQTAQK